MHSLSLSTVLVALLSAVATAVPQNAHPTPPNLITGKLSFTTTSTTSTTSTTPATTTTQSPAYHNLLYDPSFEETNERFGGFMWWHPWEARVPGSPSNQLVRFSTIDTRSAHTGRRGMSIEFPKNNTQVSVTQGIYQDNLKLWRGLNYRFVGWLRPNVPYPPCSLHVFIGNGQHTVREHLVWRPAGSIPGTGWAIDTKNFSLGGNYSPVYLNIRVQCNSYRTQDIRFDFDDFELFQI